MTRPIPFQLVDCTLREGEQFAGASFRSEQRLQIARALDAFGVEVIELTSPVASPAAARDAAAIAALGLRAQVAVHIRCCTEDAFAALACGVDAVHLVMGTSPELRQHSHGRDIGGILAAASDVIPPLLAAGCRVRFSCEDAFRTPMRELLRVAQAVEGMGVHRIGLADTVGAATPDEVSQRIASVRQAVECAIEFHGHNDGDCAVANTWAAYRAGATHLDVTVLGIGERNGICALGGLMARALQSEPEAVSRYQLTQLPDLDALIAAAAGISIPFNACITGPHAFAHKAGLHTKAVLSNPASYESIDPSLFGRQREILVGHALVGRHAVRDRARSLGIKLEGEALQRATRSLKALADHALPTPLLIEQMLRQHAEQPSAEGVQSTTINHLPS